MYLHNLQLQGRNNSHHFDDLKTAPDGKNTDPDLDHFTAPIPQRSAVLALEG